MSREIAISLLSGLVGAVIGLLGAMLTYWLASRKEERSCRKVAEVILRGIRDDVEKGLEILRRFKEGNIKERKAIPKTFWDAHSAKMSGRVLETASRAAKSVKPSVKMLSPEDFLIHATRYFSEICVTMSEEVETPIAKEFCSVSESIDFAQRLSSTLSGIIDALRR